MNRKQLLTGSFAALGILVFILDGRTALIGAQTGIDLCIRTVIPCLFPFFFLTILLNGTLSGSSVSILRPVVAFLKLPAGTEAILLTGFLGGYPTGAQAIASAFHAKQLNKETANRMLSFCSNAGPAFLFGMVSPLFSNKTDALLLWAIHIFSAVLVAILLPYSTDAAASPHRKYEVTVSGAMRSSIIGMASVCGWVILFRVVLEFINHWFLRIFPVELQVILCGIIELSNGCCALTDIHDPDLRFVICSGMLAWGGLCVALQTQSVTEGLSMRAYLKGKVLQTLFSLLLSASVCLNICVPATALLLLTVLLIRKTQKSGSNPAIIGV